MSSKTINPKKGSIVDLKISLRQIVHKIIRNKTKCEFVLANLCVGKG